MKIRVLRQYDRFAVVAWHNGTLVDAILGDDRTPDIEGQVTTEPLDVLRWLVNAATDEAADDEAA